MKKYLVLVGLVSIVFFSSLVFLLQIKPVKATDPSYPDQGCADVLNSGLYTWADHNPTVIFTPRFNWLNGVSIRIKGSNPTGTPRVTAEIWDWHSNPHRMLALHTVELENRVSEYWQFITESSQDLDPGLQYALVVKPKDGTQVYLSATTDTSCYSRGYAMHDGAQDLSLMYGFVTYGWYDPNNPNSDGTMPGGGTPNGGSTTGSTGSTGAPSSDPVAGSGSSSGSGTTGSSGSSSSGSGTSGSSSKSTGAATATPKSSFTPDIAAILADYGADENSGGFLGFLANVFSSPIMFYLWPLLSLLFWIGVIVLIVVLIRRRKKKNETVAVSTGPEPTKTEEKPKEEEKKK